MRLFRRFRVLKTTRETPDWLATFRWVVAGLVGLALLLVILFQGYRLPGAELARTVLRYLVTAAAVGTLADVLAGWIGAPGRGQFARRHWSDLVLVVLLVAAILFQRMMLPLAVLRQLTDMWRRFANSQRYSGFLEAVREQPVRMMAVGFLLLIAAGTLLLTLPAATADGRGTPFIDALFTTTSAVSTTGLVTVDTGSHYSLLGQLVVLGLFQVGGLGYMVFIALALLGLGRSLPLSGQLLLRESVSRPSTIDLRRFVGIVVAFTAVIEAGGALLLALQFLRVLPWQHALYSAAFHSVSAFCTAGFGLYSDSLMAFRANLGINLTVDVLSTAGSLGFFVLYELYHWAKTRLRGRPAPPFSVHTRLVLTMTSLLVLLGGVVILFAEWQGVTARLGERLLTAGFQAVAAATTTGFNTIDIGRLALPALLITLLLMFVGAAPGSTGGGIKNTTMGVLLARLWAGITGRSDAVLFGRRVPLPTIAGAAAVATGSALWIAVTLLVLSLTEQIAFAPLLFEVVSAFGTVGLSTGVTSQLSWFGKVLISLTMFFGRLGPVAFGLTLLGRARTPGIALAEADVMVG